MLEGRPDVIAARDPAATEMAAAPRIPTAVSGSTVRNETAAGISMANPTVVTDTPSTKPTVRAVEWRVDMEMDKGAPLASDSAAPHFTPSAGLRVHFLGSELRRCLPEDPVFAAPVMTGRPVPFGPGALPASSAISSPTDPSGAEMGARATLELR